MASLRVLAFDHAGRPVQFDTWLDDLQLYLLSNSKDGVSLFDLASGAATAPPATADISTRSRWLNHDAAARLAIRNHLPLAECAHFGQHTTAQALYDAVVARYSSLATAALGRLLLPYLFPELNPPPMYITLYFIVTRLPDSLRSVRDHFLSLDPTSLTVDLLEKHLLAAETSAVAVGAAYGTQRQPFFEGCSSSPLAPSYASAAAADVSVPEDVGAASRCFFCHGLYLPSFSTNLVSTAALQDAMVTTTTPGGQRVLICTCTRTKRHLATFTRRPGSSLYTLATEPSQVAVSAQVSASGQVAASCSCRLLSHQTLLWHHRLGHPSLPRLRGMHSRLLVSGLPRSLPPLPPSPAPSCLPCVKGWQRAAPHSSSFPPTTAPLQTLHTDVWGPAHVSGQSRKRYFLLVIDDYTRYTTVFPLRNKGQVVDVLIPWIRTVRLQLRERFGPDLPVLRLHSDRGGEFSSSLLRDFCRGDSTVRVTMCE
ncbi:unnamed protein product [Closterium sp. NIES-54]